MAEMKKNPDNIQGRNTGKQFSDETGELRDGSAKGHPSYENKTGEKAKKNKQINPNESRIMDSEKSERVRGSDEKPERNARRNGSSL